MTDRLHTDAVAALDVWLRERAPAWVLDPGLLAREAIDLFRKVAHAWRFQR